MPLNLDPRTNRPDAAIAALPEEQSIRGRLRICSRRLACPNAKLPPSPPSGAIVIIPSVFATQPRKRTLGETQERPHAEPGMCHVYRIDPPNMNRYSCPMGTAPKTTRGTARRKQLLRSAEMLIGEKGFAAASIAEITRNAETAPGTFYIYFGSKEQVFRELVDEMGHLTRRIMTEAVSGAPDRLEAERRGLLAFLRFVAERPSLYSIVEQARFVDPEAYREYFSSFATAYRDQLATAEAAGQIRPGNAEVRAWALMGIAKSLGDRFCLWEEPGDLETIADTAFDMIRDGLAP